MTTGGDRPPATSGPGSIVFVGAVHEAEPALRALVETGARLAAVVTLDPERARRTAGFVDLEPLARAAVAPLLRVADLNAPAEVARLRALQPDLIVVVGWTRLLGDELLALPPRGCVGFHASLLPLHRGRAPVNWAILRGETRTGNTMMYLAPGADTGDIIDQREVLIGPDDTCGTVYAAVARAGAEMLRAHLPALLAGTAPRRPQSHGDAGMLPKRTPAMGITDWSRSARQVHDWIRALSHPYPGAFTRLGGRKLYLWGSRLPEPGSSPPGGPPEPGALLGLDGEAVRVQTGEGPILVTRVQQEHEEEESGAAWFARRGLRDGMSFDAEDPALLRWARGEGPRPESA